MKNKLLKIFILVGCCFGLLFSLVVPTFAYWDNNGENAFIEDNNGNLISANLFNQSKYTIGTNGWIIRANDFYSDIQDGYNLIVKIWSSDNGGNNQIELRVYDGDENIIFDEFPIMSGNDSEYTFNVEITDSIGSFFIWANRNVYRLEIALYNLGQWREGGYTPYGAKWYSTNNYDNAYTEGYDDAEDLYEPQLEEQWQFGYDWGYEKGQEDTFTQNGLKNMFNTILSYPVNLIKGSLDFNFMGVNIASLVMFLISSALIVFIIMRLRK